MDEVDADWDRIWGLDHQVQQGQGLQLTDEVRALLLRAAPTVGVSPADAQAALRSEEGATAMVRLMEARIRDGSNRIGDALLRMYELQDAGDLEGARRQMEEVLAVETVPHYRKIAEGQLKRLSKR